MLITGKRALLYTRRNPSGDINPVSHRKSCSFLVIALQEGAVRHEIGRVLGGNATYLTLNNFCGW